MLGLEPQPWRAAIIRFLSPPVPTGCWLLFSFPVETVLFPWEGERVPASRNASEAIEEDGGWWVASTAAAFSPLCVKMSPLIQPAPLPCLSLSPPCACCLCLLARWFLLSCQRQHYHILVARETGTERDNDLNPLAAFEAGKHERLSVELWELELWHIWKGLIVEIIFYVSLLS